MVPRGRVSVERRRRARVPHAMGGLHVSEDGRASHAPVFLSKMHSRKKLVTVRSHQLCSLSHGGSDGRYRREFHGLEAYRPPKCSLGGTWERGVWWSWLRGGYLAAQYRANEIPAPISLPPPIGVTSAEVLGGRMTAWCIPPLAIIARLQLGGLSRCCFQAGDGR